MQAECVREGGKVGRKVGEREKREVHTHILDQVSSYCKIPASWLLKNQMISMGWRQKTYITSPPAASTQ